ncbi:UNVERIFIED_CONTAM: hypothetical protein Slati_3908700 [Sesamum latifolium]|uniref:Transposase Tnp1/En/Spm-like domain-containing protein n=1 Tax=Sesamum latifolium TaxID=2727402 RepID=A0AAW2TP22_9LAMI
MQQEGKDTTQLDMFIEFRSCGKGIEADPATANLIQEFREGLSKRPESEQTKEFKEDLFVNSLGEDPHGRVRSFHIQITLSRGSKHGHKVVAINADNRRTDNGYNCSPIQVESNVILFCSEISKEIMAEGTLLSIDPNEKIDEVALGYEFIKVVIRKAIKPDYLLLRPRRGVNTIQDVVGKSVAWEYIDV